MNMAVEKVNIITLSPIKLYIDLRMASRVHDSDL